ncbi:facilitated trehalose transporter Tret1 [Amyelois transitella]|uniref:facilitated trehalose transporter Tret1 n=1 Tax=Amyelois transitella TaxID=680683 RepID=UPI00298F6F70|nr:facilitated trehalose transporter Tret1 [Amyelois transitella]
MGKTWITPFVRQCYVTAGTSLNMASHGFVMGFAAVLLPQLRKPDSIIPIDQVTGSWIVSTPAISQVLGNFIVPSLMNVLGRRRANLISILVMIICWLTISVADNFITIIICRAIQGVSLGISASLSPILIGEYTSPKNRGSFITTLSVAMSIGVLTIHTLGSYSTWQITALVVAIIAFVDFLMVIYSPESPIWLADKGRYSECRSVFMWLRGSGEEDELNKMIEAAIIINNIKAASVAPKTITGKVKKSLSSFSEALTKREFYKPIFIMINVYNIGIWSAVALLTTYIIDVIHYVVGTEVDVPVIVISLGIQRIVSNLVAVYLYKTFKRKTLLYVLCGLNALTLFATGIYVYAKLHNLLPFDHPSIGVILIHLHMFSGATGCVPFPFIIAGEIFPTQYKSLAGGISVVIFSCIFSVMIKSVPSMFITFGLHGSYFIYGVIVTYFLIVSGIFLPETKDRTLQDIEDEFRGKPIDPEELKSMQSLTTWQKHKMDRRCSSPLI